MPNHIKDDRIQVTGHLRDDAKVLYGPGGHTAVLVAEIEPAKGLPYLVIQQLGSSAAAHIAAKAKAKELRKGCRVTVHAVYYELYRATNGMCLRLQGVQDVIPQEALPERIAA